MKRILQNVLFTGFLMVLIQTVNAQTERLKVVDKSDILPSAVPVPHHSNIEEKKIVKPSLEPATNTTRKVTQDKVGLQKTNSRIQMNTAPSAKLITTEKPGESVRKINPEAEASQTVVSTVKTDEPLFPNFQVTGTQEVSYEDKVVSKENKPQQLERLSTVTPKDETNLNSPAPTGHITLSPLKRKYLEGVVKELESEISLNANDPNTDILAKQKELDDLKKLLSQ